MKRSCQFCRQSFTKMEHLQRHERSHTKEQPFSCSECGKKYTRRDSLMRHVRKRERLLKVNSAHELARSNPPNPMTFLATSDTCDGLQTLASVSAKSNIDKTDQSSLFLECTQVSSSDAPSTVTGQQSQSIMNKIPSVVSVSYGSRTAKEVASQPSDAAIIDDGPIDPTSVVQPAERLNSKTSTYTFQSSMDLGALASTTDTSHYAMSLGDISELAEFLCGGEIDFWSSWTAGGNNNFSIENLPRSRVMSPDPERPGHIPSRAIERAWYTNLTGEALDLDANASHYSKDFTSAQIHPIAQKFIDEDFRKGISANLRLDPENNEPWPSVDYMNLCIGLYFDHFHPTSPIIHRPTFHPTPDNVFLVVALCAVGTMFIGTPATTRQGAMMIRRLFKVCMATWEKWLSGRRDTAVALAQGAIIGQTYNMLTGDRMAMALAQTFHGTVITWARRVGAFDYPSIADIPDISGLNAEDLDAAWRHWAKAEELKRTGLYLYLHDVENASLHFVWPELRHAWNKLPIACTREAFEAPDSQSWANVLARQPLVNVNYSNFFSLESSIPPHTFSSSTYTLSIILAGIEAQVLEMENLEDESQILAATDNATSQLLKWRDAFNAAESRELVLLISWHAIFVSLFASIDMITQIAGRLGPARAQAAYGRVKTWRASQLSYRAMLHVTLVWRLVSELPVATEPPINLLRKLFHCGVVAVIFRRAGDQKHEMGNWAELLTSAPPSTSHSREEHKWLTTEGNIFAIVRRILATLRGMGPWGVGKRFAHILALIWSEELGEPINALAE